MRDTYAKAFWALLVVSVIAFVAFSYKWVALNTELRDERAWRIEAEADVRWFQCLVESYKMRLYYPDHDPKEALPSTTTLARAPAGNLLP